MPPKRPPSSVRSIRLPDSEWARLAGQAEARGLSVNALVAELVAEKPVRAADAAPVIGPGLVERVRAATATPKPVAKPAIKVNVPLASDIVRKPMQKTGKK